MTLPPAEEQRRFCQQKLRPGCGAQLQCTHTCAWRGGVTINQTSAFSQQRCSECDSGDERRAAPEDNNARARADYNRTDICWRRRSWLQRICVACLKTNCPFARVVCARTRAREGELCIATPNLHVKAFLRPVCLSHNRRRALGTQLLH